MLAAVLLLGAVLLAATLPGVRSDLTASKRALQDAQDSLGEGDVSRARAQLRVAAARAAEADGRTHGLLWRAYGHVPVARGSVHELRAMSRAMAVTTRDVLPPLLDLTTQRPWSGRVDTRAFAALRPPLTRAQVRLDAVRRELRAAPRSDIAQIDGPRHDLDDSLTRLAVSINEARVAAVVVPSLLEGRHRFLLVVQNNAEPRATGGLLGSYGLLQVQDGAFRLLRTGPNQDLVDRTDPVVELGAEYDARYARFGTTTTWRSANLTADTPTAGRILTGLWKAQFGEQLDGVLFVDPVALAELLGATGPVTLEDGTRISASNAVQRLLVDVYRRFPSTADAERNRYMESATRQVVDRLGKPGLDGTKVLHRVSAAAASGHLQVYAHAAALEAELVTSRVGGALRADGPFLSLVTQDVGGSKLGAYLRRRVDYTARPTGEATDLGTGPRLEEEGSVTVTLTNAAPAGLPTYVTARPDDPAAPVGQAKYWVSVYLGEQATLLGATLDGKDVALESGTERGLSVLSTFFTVNRGASRTLVLRVRQLSRPGQPLIFRQQPLLRPDELHVDRAGAPLERVYAE